VIGPLTENRRGTKAGAGLWEASAWDHRRSGARRSSWAGGATAGGAEPQLEGRSHSWRGGATLTEGSMTPIQHPALIQETEVRGQQEQVWIRGTTLGPPMTPPSRAPPLCTK
jgi:hypothetical protein